MSERFDSNLILNIKVSYFLMILLLVMHLGGAMVVSLVALAWPLKVLLWIGLTVSAVQAWRRYGTRTTPAAVTGFELDGEGCCSVRRGPAGVWQTCTLVQAVVHPWLVILLLRSEGRRWPSGLAIAADAVDPEPFRRLRARLRLQTRAA